MAYQLGQFVGGTVPRYSLPTSVIRGWHLGKAY